MNKGFTLIELIVVIIIVGILAAVGISQYSLVVEQGRTGGAKTRIGTMRQLAYEYYLNNATVSTITNTDVGVDNTCTSSDFYKYWVAINSSTFLDLVATRCTSSGKTPNASRRYDFFLRYHLDTGTTDWRCYYPDDLSPCFGLPSGVGGG